MTHILIIEPDTALANIYAAALQIGGYKVNIASSAQAAINLADKNSPDLVILEVQLAQHNGLEFLYEFRSYPEWQNVPVLIHTVVPPTELTDNSMLWNELNVVGYLYKPGTSLKQLLHNIAAIYELQP